MNQPAELDVRFRDFVAGRADTPEHADRLRPAWAAHVRVSICAGGA